jgi:hypothetical protein
VISTNGIPGEVFRFLEANVDSIEQLEILRILGECPEREWCAASLARLTQTQHSIITAALETLESRGLLTTRVLGADLLCRYNPHTASLEKPLNQLLGCYRERPVTVIKMLYARGNW